MKKTILVVGGAGYIGSHTAYLLAQQGHRVIVLDNLIHGQTFSHSWATFIKGDFADQVLLESLFEQYKIDTVMHFAAFIEVGESVKRPREFYHNNVIKTIQLLDTMIKCHVKKIIFSSSCAVYGIPTKIPLREDHGLAPLSPYGKNKLIVEFVLQDYAVAYGLKYVSLRYFNASGALYQEGLGEYHVPETHLIPLVLRAGYNKTPVLIFGDDYPTQDGSCVRDYIHVVDIAQAHVYGLDYLERGGASDVFNLGTGTGYSVKEIIDATKQFCSLDIITHRTSRRPGDVPVLVADYNKAKTILGWEPRHSTLEEILKSAHSWEMALRK